MADNILTENDGWTRHEQSVFKINRSFRPPFYVKTLGGYYDKEEELCFSAGDEYIILHKLKIKSVIASIVQGSHHRVSLKIPLDYAGKFYPISNSRTQSPEALPLKDMLYSNELPIEVRLGNPQQHGKLFLEKLRSNLDCVLKLSDQVTDDYFLGRSVDGKLVFLFSTEENMNFLVKKVNTNDVNHLLMNMAELKYDIFIVNVSNPGVQFLKLEDAVTNRTPPRRPPKPSSLPAASNTVQNRFGDKKTRKTLHKEVVTINFQKGGSSAKPAFSPPIPPIPTKKTKDQAKPPPPPLPSYPHPDDDEENDTDEEYNDKAAEQVTYPPRGGEDIRNVTVPPLPPSLSTHSRKPPPLPPPHEKYENMDENNTSVPPRRHFEKAARPDSDYLTPSQSLNQNDSDSDLSDYENIDSDLSDYERVEPQDEEPYRTPQSPLPSPTSPTTANISPKTKKKFNIKNKFSKLKWKNSKKEMASGDMADDELTEDPYAEQQADRRVSKKHYRSPHDALPMPTQPGPFSMPPSLPGHFIPPGRSLPSGRSQLPPPSHNIEDSDSDLSDYERVDDDEPKAAWKYGQGQPIRLQSPPKPASSMGGSMRQRLPDPNPKTGVPSNVGIVHPSTVQIVQPVKSSSEEFPRELCHLSVEAVAETLRKLKMPDNVVENFRDAQIDGQIFVCLDDNMLDQLEVGSLHKLKIIKFKNGWRPNHT
ncbi:uncharacterized protein [Amphiura filiformis]|uniref:uncharacterized protein isoform X5 n=1 Tax=Amphiura filiformis TaxID=82378 RepID=UPI003B226F8F